MIGEKDNAYLIILWDDALGKRDPDTAAVFGIYYSEIKAEKEFHRIVDEAIASDLYKHGEQIDLMAILIRELDEDPIIEDRAGKPATERLYNYLSETIWPSLTRKMIYEFRDERDA